MVFEYWSRPFFQKGDRVRLYLTSEILKADEVYEVDDTKVSRHIVSDGIDTSHIPVFLVHLKGRPTGEWWNQEYFNYKNFERLKS